MNPFKVGDRADHLSGTLDSREVVRVEGPFIWLRIGTTEAGPIPADAYRRIPKEES